MTCDDIGLMFTNLANELGHHLLPAMTLGPKRQVKDCRAISDASECLKSCSGAKEPRQKVREMVIFCERHKHGML